MKIKNLLPLFALGLVLASCKKEYTCDCTTTDTYTDNNGVKVVTAVENDSKAYSAKMTEKQAKAACEAEAPAIESNFLDLYESLNGAPPEGELIETTCKLK